MEDYKYKYDQLADKVQKLFDAQQKYYATKSKQDLIICKNYQQEIKNILKPKQISQATFNWLEQ